ncbi:MAG: HupE/UreJ family protein [Pseudomonadota bacterium]
MHASQPVRSAFHLIALVAILLLAISPSTFRAGEALAHPEDDFCEADSGIDPALCRKLAESNSSEGREVSPLLDEDGNVRSALDTAFLYLEIGIRHILPGGADHILFVLALFLASERLRSLIIQISAFTVAHTATLGLAAAGVFEPPASIVEPLIAFSIAFVAIENIFLKDISKWRPFLVFGFGLIHGLGFAGFIRDVGLPPGQFWSSLIGFNVGVELGQLAVVLAAFILRIPVKHTLKKTGVTYRNAIVIPASLVIAAIGLWWGAARTFGF